MEIFEAYFLILCLPCQNFVFSFLKFSQRTCIGLGVNINLLAVLMFLTPYLCIVIDLENNHYQSICIFCKGMVLPLRVLLINFHKIKLTGNHYLFCTSIIALMSVPLCNEYHWLALGLLSITIA